MRETVLVCWLDDGDVKGPFAESLLNLVVPSALNGLIAGWHRLESGPMLDQGRNDLTDAFLETGAEWMLMVDADMTFEASMLERLLEAADPIERPIVGPLCYSVNPSGVWPVMFRLVDNQFRPVANPPEDMLVQVGGLGAGCLLIHRTVFEQMAAKWPGDGPFDRLYMGGEPLGEDLSFCAKAADLGIPIHCHTGIPIGHQKIQLIANRESFLHWREGHRFIVTGTGRCGTGYVAEMFKQMQVPCGHELLYRADGPHEWGPVRGDSSWMAAPYLRDFRGAVIHLLRNPLAVVNSLVGIGFFNPDVDHGAYREFARKWCPQAFRTDDMVLAAATLIIHWNRMIAPHADMTVRVEEIDPPLLRDMLGLVGSNLGLLQIGRRFDRVGTDFNHRTRAQLGWDDMPSELADHAEELGYGPAAI